MARRGRGEPAQDGALAVGVSSSPRALSSNPTAFARLKWTSFFHSCVYTSLLICAFALGKPQPETLVLGWTHGLLWIGMSLACITAARMRIVPLRLAVAVAVLGGIGPFFGSAEFVRTQKGHQAVATGRRAAGATVRESKEAPPPAALD
jgi:hypothetical protein